MRIIYKHCMIYPLNKVINYHTEVMIKINTLWYSAFRITPKSLTKLWNISLYNKYSIHLTIFFKANYDDLIFDD